MSDFIYSLQICFTDDVGDNFCFTTTVTDYRFETYFYTKMIFVSNNKIANGTIAMPYTIIYDVPLVRF